MKNLRNHNLSTGIKETPRFKGFEQPISVPGSTLAEVLIAISITGLMLTSIFALQNSSFSNLAQYSKRLHAIITMNNELIAQHKEQQTAKEKKNKDSKTIDDKTVTYTRTKITEESIFKKCSDLYIEKLNISWQQWGINYQENIVSLQYTPKKIEKANT